MYSLSITAYSVVSLAFQNIELGHDEVQVGVVRETLFDFTDSLLPLALVDQLLSLIQ